jgi:hypothetical protein
MIPATSSRGREWPSMMRNEEVATGGRKVDAGDARLKVQAR